MANLAIDTVIVNKYSGDYRIDVLLPSATARWNNGKAVGSAVELTFSFMNAIPSYAGETDKKGFSVFTEEQKNATREILKKIAEQFGLTFKEVSDSDSSFGVVRFGNNAQGSKSAGYASYPDTDDPNGSGDVYINNEDPANLSNVVPGTNAWATLVHEIGHAIGLKHPGNYNAGEPASTTPDNFLATAEDTEANTVMSYNKAPQAQERDFFGKYDYLALNYLYGSRAYNEGNTNYAFNDKDGEFLKIINDSAGNDTLDFSAVSRAVSVNLTPGANSSVGKLANGADAKDNLSIAFGVTIENVIGSRFADTLLGNDANNRFESRGGGDQIDGGAGLDTVVFGQARAAYSVEKSANGLLAKAGNETISLQNIERLQFSDNKVLAFDLDAVAGKAYRLYQAAFDRKPDAEGLGYWIANMDKGVSFTAVADAFIGSPEFQKLYGKTPANADLVTSFYKNVLHRAPEADGYNFWLGILDGKKSTVAEVLTSFAESPENKAQVAGNIQAGIDFNLWLA